MCGASGWLFRPSIFSVVIPDIEEVRSRPLYVQAGRYIGLAPHHGRGACRSKDTSWIFFGLPRQSFGKVPTITTKLNTEIGRHGFRFYLALPSCSHCPWLGRGPA